METENSYTPLRPLNTAVLFMIFNRIDTTRQVFDAIREAKPPRLYIAADGARVTKDGESERVNAVRDYVLSKIDWPCEVKTLFREKNLGCKYAVSSAITWFFENEEMGIILEDDCLPSQSFFWFCEELLIKYRNDLRVWHIGGVSNITKDLQINNDSYYFSKFNHIWGWASWANRWKSYDVNIPLLQDFLNNKYIENISDNTLLQSFWLSNFKNVYNGNIDTWDYQWYFTTWINGGISIIPTINLVTNIGFGMDATHTTDDNHHLSNVSREELNTTLIHPRIMMPNSVYDKFNADFLFNLSYLKFYFNKLKSIIKIIIRKK